MQQENNDRLGDVVRALDIANAFRALTGQERIEELVSGVPNDATQCVLARTFNKGCYVTYVNADDDKMGPVCKRLDEQMSEAQRASYQEWGIVVFDGLELAKALSGETKFPWTEVHAEEEEWLSGHWSRPVAVALPDDVTWIAKEFDDERWPEYEVIDDEDAAQVF